MHMPEHMLFHIVLLGQILVISVYLPGRLLGRMRRLVADHPPAEYPKLYPVSLERVGDAAPARPSTAVPRISAAASRSDSDVGWPSERRTVPMA